MHSPEHCSLVYGGVQLYFGWEMPCLKWATCIFERALDNHSDLRCPGGWYGKLSAKISKPVTQPAATPFQGSMNGPQKRKPKATGSGIHRNDVACLFQAERPKALAKGNSNTHTKHCKQHLPVSTKWLWVKNRCPTWLALVNGHMDQNLRFFGGLTLTHSQVMSKQISKARHMPRLAQHSIPNLGFIYFLCSSFSQRQRCKMVPNVDPDVPPKPRTFH